MKTYESHFKDWWICRFDKNTLLMWNEVISWCDKNLDDGAWKIVYPSIWILEKKNLVKFILVWGNKFSGR